MQRIIIHVKHRNAQAGYDLEVPAHIPVEKLSRHLAHALNWHSDEFDYRLQVEWPPNKPLKPNQSLAEAGLWDGAHLTLLRRSKPRPTSSPKKVEERKIRAQLSSPRSGKRYDIFWTDVLIGRSTPHTPPIERERLVDLKEEPGGDTVSRKHARLFFEKKQWHLEVLRKVHNRTFCNDRQLEAGDFCTLHDGVRLKFGRVVLIFHNSP